MKSVIKKYHRYFTNAADTDKKAVIRNDRGRRMEILDRYCRAIGDDNRKAKEPVYKAMLLKESFVGVYEYESPDEAKEYPEGWIKDALNSSLDMFKKIAASFYDKLQYIINRFKKKISSAVSEGINNKIKRLKRMAYGYKDVDYFRLKIHQHCGLLNPGRFSS